ncbi:hypothetical protein [Anaerovorax sp. IOR16]|uniref:hypothetical protein n=1 Tax=Anaerovorax sp. IOR16 TaxID=2773458 RepID=UPI0019D2AF8A|nr:hypothetical protein [Anaerovorax sp. IOR16]
MRSLICTFALVLLLSSFSIFQVDNDSFLLQQEKLKHVADDCAAAASLYYTSDSYGDGIRIFDKDHGNSAVSYLIKQNLKEDPLQYYVYYFDGDGHVTEYKGKDLVKRQKVEYPYLFEESLTGFKEMVYEPKTIVTIDYKLFDYRLVFLRDARLIRTSGYEYVGS